MDTKYYLAINNKQEGPYSLQQLRDMNLDANTLVWYDGLDEWKKLENLPILSSQLSKTETPPSFDEEKYNIVNNVVFPMLDKRANPTIHTECKQQPNNYLAEAIISLLFCNPLALIAIYKSLKVNKLHSKGHIEEANRTAKQARNFAIAAAATSVLFLIFQFFSPS